MGLEAQSVLVFGIVALAAAYGAHRVLRAVRFARGRKPGCGGDCGCE